MATVRKLHCELGPINRADGSALVNQGDTSVMCGIYGPVEVKASRELCDSATLEVIVRGESGPPGPRERLMESFIASCCESTILMDLHPHSAISVTIQILKDQGSVLSCMVHALCLALLDAALPMNTTFSSLTCCYTKDGHMITDPSSHDGHMITDSLSRDSDSFVNEMVYVVDRRGHLLCSHTRGLFTVEQYSKGLSAVQSASQGMTDFYRKAMSRKLSRVCEFKGVADMFPIVNKPPVYAEND